MKLIIRLLLGLALLAAIGWASSKPDWDSWSAVAVAAAAFIRALVATREASPGGQQQTVSGRGVGIQAGGNVSVGSIGPHKKDEKDV